MSLPGRLKINAMALKLTNYGTDPFFNAMALKLTNYGTDPF